MYVINKCMIDKHKRELLVHQSSCDKRESIESRRKHEPFRQSPRVLDRASQTISQTRRRP